MHCDLNKLAPAWQDHVTTELRTENMEEKQGLSTFMTITVAVCVFTVSSTTVSSTVVANTSTNHFQCVILKVIHTGL